MILRKIAIGMATLAATASFVACNTTSYSSEELSLPGNTAVKAFSLAEDDSVMADLDSVFFSIDLVKGLIFNADSLPVGTKVTEIKPVVTTAETASTIKFTVTRANGTDTVITYDSKNTAAVDFTNPVKMLVTSSDGKNSREYTLKLNVHKTVGDTLSWADHARTVLPTSLSAPARQRTVRMADNLFCLTAQGSEYCLASHTGSIAGLNGATLSNSEWTMRTVTFPFTPVVEELRATDTELFILDTDGNLWKSSDNGASWTAAGVKWNHIYGAHGQLLLGCYRDAGGNWFSQTYPELASAAMPKAMPVSGTSETVTYSFDWSDRTQTMMVGGRLADGTLTPATWGFDGNSWTQISNANLGEPLENVALASYVSFASALSLKSFPTLMAMGGRNTAGQLTNTVYISTNRGYSWSKARQQLQLPQYMGKFTDAQAIVMSSTYKSDIAAAPARIIKPTVEWECPYIYLFGGIGEQATLNNTVWRGVINRLTFKPLE